MRYVTTLLALLSALLLLALAGPAATGSQAFNPTFDITLVSSIAPGAAAMVSREIAAPAGGHGLGKEVLTVPAGWGIKPDNQITAGTIVGGGFMTADLDCNPGTTPDSDSFNILEEDLPPGSPLKARWVTDGLTWAAYTFNIQGSDAAGHTITTFFDFGSTLCAPMTISMNHDANVLTNPTTEGDYTWSSQLTSSPLPPGEHVVTVNEVVSIGVDTDGDLVPDWKDNCDTVPNGPNQAGLPGVGNQTDFDLDGLGDACDPDDDGDGILDGVDGPNASCQFAAEDFDSYKDSDGCPDFDNDGDTIIDYPTANDACPGSDATAGPDGIAGTADDNPRTTEDFDGVLDSDGCYDPPGADYDGDGWTDDAEVLFLGTNAARYCPLTSVPNDEEPDPWPVDFNDNRAVQIDDVFAVSSRFGTVSGDPTYSARADVANQNGAIQINDLFAVTNRFNESC